MDDQPQPTPPEPIELATIELAPAELALAATQDQTEVEECSFVRGYN